MLIAAARRMPKGADGDRWVGGAAGAGGIGVMARWRSWYMPAPPTARCKRVGMRRGRKHTMGLPAAARRTTRRGGARQRGKRACAPARERRPRHRPGRIGEGVGWGSTPAGGGRPRSNPRGGNSGNAPPPRGTRHVPSRTGKRGGGVGEALGGWGGAWRGEPKAHAVELLEYGAEGAAYHPGAMAQTAHSRRGGVGRAPPPDGVAQRSVHE